MMNNLYVFLVLGVSVSLFSCGADDSLVELEDQELTEVTPEVESDLTVSKGSKLLNESGLFSESKFGKFKILDTLFQALHPAVDDGFVLMCKYEREGIESLKTFVFDRSKKGVLVKCNEFDASFLGSDTSVVRYPNIMLRFVEYYGQGERYYYNCWFARDEAQGKYVFAHCLSINKMGKDNKYIDVYVAENKSSKYQGQTDLEVNELLLKSQYLN